MPFQMRINSFLADFVCTVSQYVPKSLRRLQHGQCWLPAVGQALVDVTDTVLRKAQRTSSLPSGSQASPLLDKENSQLVEWMTVTMQLACTFTE